MSQKKILGIISRQITDAGFEAIYKSHWANAGAIYVEHAGQFGTKVKVTYNFQNNYFTLAIWRCAGDRDTGVPSQPGRAGYFDHYLKYSDVAGFTHFQLQLATELARASGAGAAKPALGPATKLVKVGYARGLGVTARRAFEAALRLGHGGAISATDDGAEFVAPGDGTVKSETFVLNTRGELRLVNTTPRS